MINENTKSRSIVPRAERLFMNFTAGVLVLTGLAKLSTGGADNQLLAAADPIIGLPFRYLLLAAGLLELGVGVACAFKRHAHFAIFLVAWFATLLLVYRVALWSVGWKAPC